MTRYFRTLDIGEIESVGETDNSFPLRPMRLGGRKVRRHDFSSMVDPEASHSLLPGLPPRTTVAMRRHGPAQLRGVQIVDAIHGFILVQTASGLLTWVLPDDVSPHLVHEPLRTPHTHPHKHPATGFVLGAQHNPFFQHELMTGAKDGN